MAAILYKRSKQQNMVTTYYELVMLIGFVVIEKSHSITLPLMSCILYSSGLRMIHAVCMSSDACRCCLASTSSDCDDEYSRSSQQVLLQEEFIKTANEKKADID